MNRYNLHHRMTMLLMVTVLVSFLKRTQCAFYVHHLLERQPIVKSTRTTIQRERWRTKSSVAIGSDSFNGSSSSPSPNRRRRRRFAWGRSVLQMSDVPREDKHEQAAAAMAETTTAQQQEDATSTTTTMTATTISDIEADMVEEKEDDVVSSPLPSSPMFLMKPRTSTRSKNRYDDDKDGNDHNEKKNWLEVTTPSPMEDQLTMTGDITSLFIYGYTDHFVNDFCIRRMVVESSATAEMAAKTLDPHNGSDLVQQVTSVPVWTDTTIASTSASFSEQALHFDTLQRLVLPSYSPLLSTAGSAAVSLCICWLLAGYVTGAFHFRNTLHCSVHRAIQTTGQTWMVSSCFMILAVAMSRYSFDGASTGNQSLLLLPMSEIQNDYTILTTIVTWLRTSLTIYDTDFIFNSLTVLLTWRILVSYLLGSGKDE